MFIVHVTYYLNASCAYPLCEGLYSEHKSASDLSLDPSS